MNSAERVFTALRNEQPDRVPVVEFVVDEKVARKAVPACIDAADCMDRLGMDGVGCGAYFGVVETHADGSYIDEWGVTYKPGPETIAHPVGWPLKNLRDAEVYMPPDPDAPERLKKLRDIVDTIQGEAGDTVPSSRGIHVVGIFDGNREYSHEFPHRYRICRDGHGQSARGQHGRGQKRDQGRGRGHRARR